MKTAKVIVLPYDERWKSDFEAIKNEIQNAVGAWMIGIEHVGSTSVEGLSAKPCIDIDVIIRDYGVFDTVVRQLAAIGYMHEGDLGTVVSRCATSDSSRFQTCRRITGSRPSTGSSKISTSGRVQTLR